MQYDFKISVNRIRKSFSNHLVNKKQTIMPQTKNVQHPKFLYWSHK